MQSKPSQSASDLGAKLREAIIQLEDVSLTDAPSGSYYTVKVGKATVGYVNGRSKIRIDGPRRFGKKQLHVAKAADVARAITFMKGFIPKPDAAPKAAAATETPKPKATPKAKASKPKAATTRKAT